MLPNRSLLRWVRSSVVACALVAAPSAVFAGVNTWTAGRSPTGEPFAKVAADPADPYVVYGAFGGDLYRSADGGRTWNFLNSWSWIDSILIHPAEPSTLYVGARDLDGDVPFGRIYRGALAGVSWAPTSPNLGPYILVSSLAATEADSSVVLAGTTDGYVYRTEDDGMNWTRVPVASSIASLVIHPRNPSIAYAGTYAASYYYFFGSFLRSTDGGSTWQDVTPGQIDTPSIAVDGETSDVFMGVALDYYANPQRSVLRSQDAGVSWSDARAGLPTNAGVLSIAVDPVRSGTLYAGTTPNGMYRSQDSGNSWTPFGQQLGGAVASFVAVSADGRFLHAGTNLGVFNLEIASGPLDVAAGPGGSSRVLYWNADRLSVGTLDASGHWTQTPFGVPSSTWTATAVASGADGLARVLWQCGDGRSGLELFGPAGSQSSFVFAQVAGPGWIATDVSVRSDGGTSALWTSADGRMSLAKHDSSGAASLGPEYGPSIGWVAVAVADGPGNDTWVLWRSTDGRAGLSLHHDGLMGSSFQWVASPGWTAEDITVGADGRPRLLRTKTDGTAEVSTVDAGGQLTASQVHGSPGFTPRRISAGADGRSRLLFSAADGQGRVFLLQSDNTVSAQQTIPVQP